MMPEEFAIGTPDGSRPIRLRDTGPGKNVPSLLRTSAAQNRKVTGPMENGNKGEGGGT
ncbi:hypothetical protein GCM10010220_59070 [Streptomyces parvulus]|nr:hypothetical protein GCM10010220_59070 [Streptomyces parvulus]